MLGMNSNTTSELQARLTSLYLLLIFLAIFAQQNVNSKPDVVTFAWNFSTQEAEQED